MAELRSFIIGVTIAGAVLLVAGLAFGLFGGDSGSPSVRLLGTPPPTRTPPPAATRNPNEFTPIPPTATSQAPVGQETPGTGETPNPIQTATPTLEVAPTAVATAAPQVNPVQVYVDTANQYTPGLVAQIEYLIGNVSAPNIGSSDWRNFTVKSAQNIQALAGGLAGISTPACVASAHGQLVASANQASSAAGQVIAAVNANDAGAASATAGALGASRDAINSAVGAVSVAVGAC